jgi:glycine C-acetyltransferase
VIAGTTLAVLDTLATSTSLRDALFRNAGYLRSGLSSVGFAIAPGIHPIVPVMVYEAPLAQQLAQRLYDLGILVTGFFYPVVPHGRARVRVQLSAAHTREQLDRALAAFAAAGKELGLLSLAGKNA